jgi:hypothetical protein
MEAGCKLMRHGRLTESCQFFDNARPALVHSKTGLRNVDPTEQTA